MMKLKILVGALAAGAMACAPAQAALIVDGTTIGQSVIVASDGHVIATYEGGDAGGVSVLFLVGGTDPIFSNGSNSIGDTVDLGFFTAGTELVFGLHSFDGNDYFTGPASRNPDDQAHAAVNTDGGVTFVGFEDWALALDDYNDLVFSFSNTRATISAVPEPASWALMIGGFALAGAVLRTRQVTRRRGAVRVRFT